MKKTIALSLVLAASIALAASAQASPADDAAIQTPDPITTDATAAVEFATTPAFNNAATIDFAAPASLDDTKVVSG